MSDFIFWGSKITADGDCSHEIKRRLLLGRRVMLTKVRLVKAMVFPVVMYGCESWTGKKAERRRIDAFEPWCWRRLLRVPWTRGFSRVAAAFSSYDGDLSLPLGLALGSPIQCVI